MIHFIHQDLIENNFFIKLRLDRNQLEEQENGQMEKVGKIFDTMEKRVRDNKESITPIDVYPEILSIVKGKTYTNWLAHGTPLSIQLPYFDSTILSIIPVKDEDKFQKAVGVNVEQLIELQKQDSVIPILQFPPMDFEGLDYLDPILEQDPPVVNIRELAFEQILSVYVMGNGPEQLMDWHHEGIELFKKVTGKEMIKFPEDHRRLISKKAQFDDDLLSNIGQSYSRLNLIKSPEIAWFAFTQKEPMMIARCLWLYEHVLFGGYAASLGGNVSWTNLDALAAKNLGVNYVKEFPMDVGKLLIKEFNLASVKDFGFEKIIQVTKETEKARKALFELDDAVNEEDANSAIERGQVLEKVWNETNEIINSMQSTKEIISKYFPVSVGVVGGLLSSFDLPGILASAAGVVTTKVLSEPILETLSKIKKPNHIISVFDLKKLST